jgi:aspartyl protease family protein
MQDRSAWILYTVLLLVLPIAALVSRRLPVGRLVSMALAWVAIFAVVIGAIMLIRG